jgi:hypothetical protein
MTATRAITDAAQFGFDHPAQIRFPLGGCHRHICHIH